jgi:hypothetical protein
MASRRICLSSAGVPSKNNAVTFAQQSQNRHRPVPERPLDQKRGASAGRWPVRAMRDLPPELLRPLGKEASQSPRTAAVLSMGLVTYSSMPASKHRCRSLSKSVGGHRDDRRMLSGWPPRSRECRFNGFEAAHDRHLHVHQDQVEKSPADEGPRPPRRFRCLANGSQR